MSESIDPRSASSHGPVHRSASKAMRRRPRVLVAEDEWSFRILLLLAFEGEGYDVVTVGDGPKFLEVLGASMLPSSGIDPFDLVVSDVRMPGWNGLLALEDLCRSPRVPPVVVITAFGSDELHKRGPVPSSAFAPHTQRSVGARCVALHRASYSVDRTMLHAFASGRSATQSRRPESLERCRPPRGR
jgi:CheY-like chemotaxis protein